MRVPYMAPKSFGLPNLHTSDITCFFSLVFTEPSSRAVSSTSDCVMCLGRRPSNLRAPPRLLSWWWNRRMRKTSIASRRSSTTRTAKSSQGKKLYLIYIQNTVLSVLLQICLTVENLTLSEKVQLSK